MQHRGATVLALQLRPGRRILPAPRLCAQSRSGHRWHLAAGGALVDAPLWCHRREMPISTSPATSTRSHIMQYRTQVWRDIFQPSRLLALSSSTPVRPLARLPSICVHKQLAFIHQLLLSPWPNLSNEPPICAACAHLGARRRHEIPESRCQGEQQRV